MNKLQPMPAGEQATLASAVEGETVHVVFTVKANGEKGTPRYNLKWHFDFAAVSTAELRKLATRSLRIDGQAMWRSAKNKMDADVWQDRKWSVRDMLDQTRSKATPAQQMDKIAPKMSKAERQAAIEMLMALDEE